ncbi:MAG: dCMP deaminase family protein [Kiritimatiellae bacterium]|nr:dCMP deaminase family protein [Kiritimatiellia bacterium]
MTEDTRPSWDEYFLRLAKDVSTRSNCSRRKVGAVIVKDNHIVATGYNGTPAKTTNCFDGGCPRCNGEHKTGEKLDECLCVHAEQNAICQAAKHGNCIDGGKIYVTCSPCLTCLKLIINSGIKEVIFGEWYRQFNDQEKKLVEESGIKVKMYESVVISNEEYIDGLRGRRFNSEQIVMVEQMLSDMKIANKKG